MPKAIYPTKTIYFAKCGDFVVSQFQIFLGKKSLVLYLCTNRFIKLLSYGL